MNRYQENLKKTFELIQTSFNLKEVYFKMLYPNLSINKIQRKIYHDILKRKQKQWK